MSSTYVLASPLLGVVGVGALLSWYIKSVATRKTLVDIADPQTLTESDGGSGASIESASVDTYTWPHWFTVVVLVTGELLALATYRKSEDLLQWLCLLAVFFPLMIVLIDDLRWNQISLGALIALSAGTLGWVMLHPLTPWVIIVVGYVALFGLFLWLIYGWVTHTSRPHGDLILSIVIGLYCAAGVQNLLQFATVGIHIGIGLAAGSLTALVVFMTSYFTNRNQDGEDCSPAQTAGSPVFVFAALFCLILR